MTSIANVKTIGAPFGNCKELVRSRYSFADDGGATGTYTVFTAAGSVLITDIWAVVKTSCAGATMTLDVGKTGTVDAFAAAVPVSSLAAAYVVQKKSLFTASGTADTPSTPCLLTDGQVITMGINTAALTAGVIEFVVEVAKP